MPGPRESPSPVAVARVAAPAARDASHARRATVSCGPRRAAAVAGEAARAPGAHSGRTGRSRRRAARPAPHSLVVLLCHRARSLAAAGPQNWTFGLGQYTRPGGGGGGRGAGGSGAAAPTGWVRFSRSERAPRGLRALGAGRGRSLASGESVKGGVSEGRAF